MIVKEKVNIILSEEEISTNVKVAVLLSGGLDSIVLCELLTKIPNVDITCLYIKYGSKHSYIELEKATKFCETRNIDLIELDINSLILNMNITSDLINGESVKVGYVPFRNMIMISLISAFAESNNIHHLFIGATLDDYNGYWDCRPEFYNNINKLFKLNESYELEIHTPLINKNKKYIYILANGLNIKIDEDTWTCYNPQINKETKQIERCHNCSACELLDNVINEVTDPSNMHYMYYKLLLDESKKLIPSDIKELTNILFINGDENNDNG
jgi:7-cyano-7-deazaguanine synthase